MASNDYSDMDEPKMKYEVKYENQTDIGDESEEYSGSEDQVYPKKWTAPMIRALVDGYREMVDRFRNPDVKIKKLWIELADGMRKKGFNVSFHLCDVKWRNMKQTFKRIHDDKTRSQNSKRSWEYYDDMLELLELTNNGRKKDEYIEVTNNSDNPSDYGESESEKIFAPKRKVVETNDAPPRKKINSRRHIDKDDDDVSTRLEKYVNEFRTQCEENISEMLRLHKEILTVKKQECALLEQLLKKLG